MGCHVCTTAISVFPGLMLAVSWLRIRALEDVPCGQQLRHTDLDPIVTVYLAPDSTPPAVIKTHKGCVTIHL